MDGFTLFKYDRVVKLHFTNRKYDIFEQKAKANGLTFENFLAKSDYAVYNAISRKFTSESQAVQFFVANYAYKNNNPIHNLAASDRNLNIWNKRKQAITHTFKEDLGVISLHLEKKKLNVSDLFQSTTSLPELFKVYLSGLISIETLYLINKIESYVEEWDKHHSLIWGSEFLLIERLDKFVQYDEETVKKIYEYFKT